MALPLVALKLQCFKHACSAHASAHAHGDHAVFLIVSAQAMQQRCDANSAGRAQRMAQRNRTTQGVDLGTIQLEIIDYRKTLGCEGFVQFYPVEIVLF